ncbi:hypothetical protein E1B28_010681 [Marasmius oreades]|uniref:Uncharacterized protein n=1 Tax=Marasmius oreades TaxID=181124 RepID=A0A9P7RYA2_9AGAR|nr:uncharacterized protein E1B28_010681 [Marasmius oreades]KAG7091660.1 hypothetical protein E1B28_010681 [Marasmius oreades]
MQLQNTPTPSQSDEFDQVQGIQWTASMLAEVDVIEAASATGQLPRKRPLSPTKNAPEFARILAEKRKTEAEEATLLSSNALLSSTVPSTPLQSPLVPDLPPMTSISQLPSPLVPWRPMSTPQLQSPFEPFHHNFLPMAGIPPPAGFSATSHMPLHPHPGIYLHPPPPPTSSTIEKTEARSTPVPQASPGTPPPAGVSTSHLHPGIFLHPPQPSSSHILPSQPPSASSSAPTIEKTEAQPTPMLQGDDDSSTTLPEASAGPGRASNAEHVVYQRICAELDCVLKNGSQELGQDPEVILGRYCIDSSVGKSKGFNSWNAFQLALNEEETLVEIVALLEPYGGLGWSSSSQPDSEMVLDAYVRFKRLTGWDKILRDMCSMSEVVVGHSIRSRRKNFDKIFDQVSALLNCGHNRYSFSGIVLMVGNNVNEDQSLARAYATPRLSQFAESCCMADSMNSLLGHARSLAYYATHREVVKDEALSTLQRLGYNIPDETLATFLAPLPEAAVANTTTTASFRPQLPSPQATSSQSSDTELTNTARKAVLARASECELSLPKLHWKKLNEYLLPRGYQVVNYPAGVTLPWDIPAPLASKGIGAHKRVEKLLLISACDMASGHCLTFVKTDASDLMNDKVPFVSFSPDADGKVSFVYASALERGKLPTRSRKKGKGKGKEKETTFAAEDDLYEEDTDSKDELEEETPTARPARVTRAKSQPPQATAPFKAPSKSSRVKLQPPIETISSIQSSRAKSQPPAKVSPAVQPKLTTKPPSALPPSASHSSAIKRVTWNLDNAQDREDHAADSASTAGQHGSGFTFEDGISRLKNTGTEKAPPISMQDFIGGARVPKRSSSSPPPVEDRGQDPRAQKKPRQGSYSLPEFPAFSAGTVASSTATAPVKHAAPAVQQAAPMLHAPAANAAVQPAAPLQATPTTAAPPGPYWQTPPHAPLQWPSGTVPGHPGYPSNVALFAAPTPTSQQPGYPSFAPPMPTAQRPAMSQEQFQQFLALAASLYQPQPGNIPGASGYSMRGQDAAPK